MAKGRWVFGADAWCAWAYGLLVVAVGQERGELIGGGSRQAGEGLFEAGPGIDAALSEGGGEDRQDRQTSATIVAAEEQPVPATNGERIHRLLGIVDVDGYTGQRRLRWGTRLSPVPIASARARTRRRPGTESQAVPLLAAKDELRPRLRVALEMLPHQRGDRIEALPHVRRIEAEIRFRGGKIEHDGVSGAGGVNAANSGPSAARSPAGKRTTCPDGQRTSMVAAATVGPTSGSAVCGANSGGFGRGFGSARGPAAADDPAASRDRSSRFQK